jgi:Leucine-rich repeat (LRR) protein
MVLRLEKNLLTKVPNLKQFPNLVELNLRANKIEDLNFDHMKTREDDSRYYKS